MQKPPICNLQFISSHNLSALWHYPEASGSAPDKPVDENGPAFPQRVVFTDHESLNFAVGVHTKTNKVAETGMTKDSESMLMIDSCEFQHEQEHAEYKTA